MIRSEVAARRTALDVASEFAQALRARSGNTVVKIRLFGSYARGDANVESDIDVAVVLDEASFRTRCDVIDLATDISLPSGFMLSPTVFDRATYERWRRQERPLVMDIEREGLEL